MSRPKIGLVPLLQRVFDAALVTSVIAVPLTMACIREYGVALFVLCSFVMGVSWAAGRLLAPSTDSPFLPAVSLGVLAIALVSLQLQPLPPELLNQLSPFSAKFLSLWGTAEGSLLGQTTWQQISVTPEATRSGLVLLIGYVIFFITLTQRLQTQSDTDQLIRLIAMSAALMACIGLSQVLISDGRFLFLFEHPTRSASWPAKGTFTNQNHFAHFMALGIGPLLWWWHSLQPTDKTVQQELRTGRRSTEKRRSSSRHRSSSLQTQKPNQQLALLVGAGAALVTVGAVMSISRGGIAVFAIAASTALCAVATNWKPVLKLVVPLGFFLVASIVAFGAEELSARWGEIAGSNSIDDLSHGRWALWSALSQAVMEFWPAGSGVGSHADVYPIWMSEQFDVRFSHAECGYLQILLETGIPGVALLTAAIGLCITWCVRGWKHGDDTQRRRITALSAALLASILHSVIDFVWYIPGCMIVTLAILACLCRSSQLTHMTAPSTSTRLPGFAALVACLLLLAVFPMTQLLADTVRRDLASAEPWKSYHADMLAIAEQDRGQVDALNAQLDTLIDRLESCLRADPCHHEAWSALAPLYLQRFELHSTNGDNQMTLPDVRDTVQQAEFSSKQEMRDWLARAFGTDLQDLDRAVMAARRALMNRPLRSEAYLVLSETAFLFSAPQQNVHALIGQAVRVRPHEPGVLFAAGLLASDTGDMDTAWDIWRHAASLDSRVARQIIGRFVNRMPVADLIQQLQPSKRTYISLYSVYNQAEDPQERQAIAAEFARSYSDSLKSDSADAFEWKSYANMLVACNRQTEALHCLQHAAKLQPEDLGTRMRLARLLTELGQFKDARRELNWLRARQPDNQNVTQLLHHIESQENPGGRRRPWANSTSQSAQTAEHARPAVIRQTGWESPQPSPPPTAFPANPSGNPSQDPPGLP